MKNTLQRKFRTIVHICISLLVLTLLVPPTSGGSDNMWVDDFDLVAIQEPPEYSPDGDPWTEGEKIPIRYQIRSESSTDSYLYTFAKIDGQWADVDPWERKISAGSTVWVDAEVVVPDVSDDGEYQLGICILDWETAAGFEYCGQNGNVMVEASTSWSFFICGAVVFGALGVLFLIERRKNPEMTLKQWWDSI